MKPALCWWAAKASKPLLHRFRLHPPGSRREPGQRAGLHYTLLEPRPRVHDHVPDTFWRHLPLDSPRSQTEVGMFLGSRRVWLLQSGRISIRRTLLESHGFASRGSRFQNTKLNVKVKGASDYRLTTISPLHASRELRKLEAGEMIESF